MTLLNFLLALQITINKENSDLEPLLSQALRWTVLLIFSLVSLIILQGIFSFFKSIIKYLKGEENTEQPNEETSHNAEASNIPTQNKNENRRS